MIKSPFKFLDSYNLEDRDIFFGRDQEITDLYRRVFESKILLVYGVSGTGKSSLINCGLASRFDDSDWLPVNVRRGNNIIESINDAFNKQAISPLKKTLSISRKLQSIYLDHFKPVYLIFDQFEELFIFGSSEEKTFFLKHIKEIIESETQCRIIFIIREEYLAGITEFEYDIHDIFSNRFRVEKMKRANAILAVEGPCKVHNFETEKGFSEEIIEKLCPAGNEIELTFLQIYLDRIFRIAVSEKKGSDKLKFTNENLTRAGSVSDLLGQFLEEQIRELDDPDKGMAILKSFVSAQGTKRQMNESEIIDSIWTFGAVINEEDLLKHLTGFVDLRILRERDEQGYFELRHDSLASKIYEKFTAIEKDIIEVSQFIDNAFSVYEKRGKFLTSDDLKYIAPYEDKLYLNKSSESFIHKSKNEIVKSRKRRRNIISVAALALIVVLSGFTLWALNEKQKSERNYLKARANSYNFLSQKVVEEDPTIALRLAEYAVSIDSVNPDIIENLNRIYYDHNFYSIVSRHDNSILSVAFSPDGKSILTGSQDSTARLWDLQGNLLHLFKGHEGIISSITFSPDGETILTGSTDKTARIWDLQGNLLQKFIGHRGIIFCVAFSPDGKTILTGSTDKTAMLWNLQGNVLRVFKGHENTISSVAFSKDCKSILTGSNDKTARLWDLQGNLLQVFYGHESAITSVAFSPDDKDIFTGSKDSTARRWDLKGNVLRVFKGHENIVTSIATSSDGKHLITGSWDKTVRLWDMQGKMLQVFNGHEAEIEGVAFSPGGSTILSGSGDRTARLWDLEGLELQEMRGHDEAINSVTFSHDGKSILTGSNDKTAMLWDLQGKILQVFRGHKEGVWSVSFSPDDKNILTGSTDKNAKLWDLEGKVIQQFTGHEDVIWAAAFSPDGKKILTGSGDKTARLWDLQGNVLHVFEGHEGSINSVAFSPDGKRILTGSWDKTARLWNLDGTLLQIFPGHDGYVNSVGFSPDGINIFTGSWDKTVRLWDLRGNMLQVFKGNDGYVSSVAFSPDGMYLLTVSSATSFSMIGSEDNTACLWDLKGNLLQMFKGHEGSIKSVAFSPDGKVIITGSWDKTARLWEIKKSHKNFMRENLYHDLSVSQKIKYGILKYKDILNLYDEKLIKEAAEYYYDELDHISKDRKTEYLINALGLYKFLIKKYYNSFYTNRMENLIMLQKTRQVAPGMN
jgi:WD40 repeat protein